MLKLRWFRINFKLISSHEGLLYIALGNLFGALLTGLFWLLLASIQNVSDYGNINYVISIGSLASSIALLGLNTTLTTMLPKGQDSIGIQANQLVLISTSICAIIVSVFNWILGPFVMGMTFWMMSSYELLARKSYKKYAVNVIGARGSQLVLSLTLYYFFGLQGIILGFIISFFIFSRTYYRSISRFSSNFEDLKKVFKTSMHLYSYNLSFAFLLYFDKLIIAPVFGYLILGYYQLGFQFLMFLSMISVSFYQYLIPEESGGKKNNKVRIYGIGISVILSALLFIFAPFIVDTFFHSYTVSTSSIRILSIGIIPMMIISTLNSTFLRLKQTKNVMFSSVIYQISQIILILFLGTIYGIDGISYSVLIALVLQSLFLLVVYSRVKKQDSYQWKQEKEN